MKAKNKFRHNKDGTTTIFLENSIAIKYDAQECLVDTDVYKSMNLGSYRWSLWNNGKINHKGYVVGGRMERIHRLIMQTPKGLQVDHINGCGLDNRVSNLRNCTSGENIRNRGKQNNNTSGFKGVRKLQHWSEPGVKERKKPWHARISITYREGRNKNLHIGVFETPEEAAQAVDKKHVELHGKPENPERTLNFPEKLNEYLKELNYES